MSTYAYKSLHTTSYRPSVYIGEVALLLGRDSEDYEAREWTPRPAPFAMNALSQLTKEEARQALAQVAEIALDMAENIDEWWKD